MSNSNAKVIEVLIHIWLVGLNEDQIKSIRTSLCQYTYILVLFALVSLMVVIIPLNIR